MKRNLPFGKINEKRKYFRSLRKGGEKKMKSEEKIEIVAFKELKDCLPIKNLDSNPVVAWGQGFRTGFRRGYNLAYKEATELLRDFNKRE